MLEAVIAAAIRTAISALSQTWKGFIVSVAGTIARNFLTIAATVDLISSLIDNALACLECCYLQTNQTIAAHFWQQAVI
jgi:hypothetical protein